MKFDSNFDDFLNAMLSLFVVSSLEGWPDIMYQSLDIVGIDKGPAFENATLQAIFFILFIFYLGQPLKRFLILRTRLVTSFMYSLVSFTSALPIQVFVGLPFASSSAIPTQHP